MGLAPAYGQPAVVSLLTEYRESGRLSHAYLFYGPAGVGKLKIARAFAADILAASHPQAAHLVATKQHPDYLEVLKESAVIRIEDIRNMEKWLYQKPYWADRRVVIINEAHFLNRESGNALLKTLEEPPSYAIIILIADNNSILPTVVSRCQPVRFGALSNEYVKLVLIENGVEPELADLTAQISGGSLKTAELLLNRGTHLLLEEVRQFLTDLRKGRGQAVVLQAETMEKDLDYRRAFSAVLRYIILMAARGEEKDINMQPETARKVLVKMDQQRQLERVNASPLFLSLDLLWEVFDLVKPA